MIEYEPAERAELLPDGRHLMSDRYRAPRVICRDGCVVEPTPQEVAALRALLTINWPSRSRRINEDKEPLECDAEPCLSQAERE
jgi:hypothetical protein